MINVGTRRLHEKMKCVRGKKNKHIDFPIYAYENSKTYKSYINTCGHFTFSQRNI